jgi:hypothetical protein
MALMIYSLRERNAVGRGVSLDRLRANLIEEIKKLGGDPFFDSFQYRISGDDLVGSMEYKGDDSEFKMPPHTEPGVRRRG